MHVESRKTCGINGCIYTPTSPGQLAKHQEDLHRNKDGDKTKFKCELCGKEIGNDNSFRKHMRAHENDDTACQYCGDMIPYADLKSHQHYECQARPTKLAVCPWSHTTIRTREIVRFLASVVRTRQIENAWMLCCTRG
jgi:DNA-directed RNA polymerase subunit RPC12/RpoP